MRNQDPINQISVEELKRKLDAKESFRLIDVREESEYEIAHIEGAVLLPLSELSRKGIQELKPDEELVLHCHHGGRSQRACEFLKTEGFKSVSNLAGGIDAWSQKIDPKVPRY